MAKPTMSMSMVSVKTATMGVLFESVPVATQGLWSRRLVLGSEGSAGWSSLALMRWGLLRMC